jgi:hypothetical protein
MNRKFLNDRYFEKYIVDRLQKIVIAIEVCKKHLNEFPDFELGRLDLGRIFRIRSLIPSDVFPAAVLEAVQSNPNRETKKLIVDVIDYLIKFRAHMAGACHDCFVNIYDIDEYSFILKKKLWQRAAKEESGHFLCIGCLEKRLKRKLKESDFDWNIPLNNWEDFRSERLMDRMGLF